MIVTREKGYSILRSGETLVFRTGHFTEGRGSVLHSGIYNRELASMLSAGIVLTIPVLLSASKIAEKFPVLSRFGLWAALLLLAAFIVLFLFFRTVVFRERSLIATFSRLLGEAVILTPGFGGKKKSGSASVTYGTSLSRPGERLWRTPMPWNLFRRSLPSTGP